jgi:hypothetical protein
MATNFIRGFRRIGWVVTVPLVAFIIFVLYEKTKEFSPTDYEAAQTNFYQEWKQGVPILSFILQPDISFRWLSCPVQIGVYFSREVPMDVVGKIVKDFARKQNPPIGAYHIETDAGKNFVVDDSGTGIEWKFTVHKQVSMLRLAGLIIGTFACVALIIQGSISILAWIFRGFKGTTHIDVS